MKKYKGYLMVVVAASLWGISGTVAQHLFQNSSVTMGWLVTVRLLGSGFLFLMLALLGRNKQAVWEVWKNKYSASHFLLFGLFGMLGVQYTYFASIDAGNAAVATLLQYAAPVIILGYFLVKLRTVPNMFEIIAVTLTLAGTFLLLTDGTPQTLAVPKAGFIWGILSAFALAFYTLYSGKLVKEYNSIIVVGWGMMIGGLALSPVYPPLSFNVASLDLTTYSLILFVIIFGTLIPFYLFIDSMRFITAKESSLLSCSEPLSAVISSVLLLGIPFGLYQGIGALCIIFMVVLLTLKPKKSAASESVQVEEMNL
ncbi:DMT family transporter [Bacillus sp. CECT 9360]|uniref:EamA family transporter n=1 Tax=Bacillus sp. CECT 9360 TaxID=2845821 RepID=UPI001E4B8A49|nr:DMT family transporter [Bacillus sp. CECT 9360]CAH0347172.1 putative inner membrane transporter YicL [Bacillus sp. CECT 9360]